MPAGIAIESPSLPTVHLTLWDRAHTRLRGRHLDHELAQGIDPRANPALALRARLLLCPASRTRIADSLDDVLRSAAEPARLSARVPLRRRAILEARPELESLSAELRVDDECGARGVALARLLLIDGASPLYARNTADDDRADDLIAALRSTYRALRVGEPD